MSDRSRARAQAKVLNKLRTLPLVAAAVKAAGVPRSTYYRWCKEDPMFRYLAETSLEAGRGAVNDLAESNVIRGVQDQDMGATKYWLSHNSERYSPKPISLVQPPDVMSSVRGTTAVKKRVASEIHDDLVTRWLEDIALQPDDQQPELLAEVLEYLQQIGEPDAVDSPAEDREHPASRLKNILRTFDSHHGAADSGDES